MKCPNCQFENRDNAKFCKSCGYKLASANPRPAAAAGPASASTVCSACGAVLKPGAKFCTKCGTAVSVSKPAPVSEPAHMEQSVSAPEPAHIEQSVSAPEPASIAQPVPEPAAEAGPEVKPEPAQETDTESVLEAKPESVSEADTESVLEMNPEPVPEADTEFVLEAKPEPVPEADTESVLEMNPESVPEADTESVLEMNPESVPEADTEFVLEAKPEPVLEMNPESVSVPEQETTPDMRSDQIPETASAPVCSNCGAALKPRAKFCSKCGTAVPASEPVSVPLSEPVPAPEPAPSPASFCKNCGTPLKPGAKFCPNCGTTTDGTQKPPVSDPPKKKTAVIILVILVILLLLGGALFALIKTGIIAPSSNKEAASGPADENSEQTEDPETEETNEEDDTEDISAELEEKLAPISEQVAAAEELQSSEDHNSAASELYNALTSYASIASEYDSQAAADIINPLADHAFALYSDSVLKQVEGWENQSVTAPLYQEIDATLKGAVDLAAQLRESNLAVTSDTLEQNYADFPARYKEKYILTFNDLRTGDEWSRTTAWQYMQDAASVGLVDRENVNDPLTLRYAYALAWITQRDLSEGMKDGSVTTESAVSSILSLAESIDYNPVLMRDLALYYDALGDSDRSKTMQSACTDVYNYLANTENVYLNGEELFVPGRNSSNASSTISLNDFWYFNDFGEYAPSGNNGVSPEGREYIRNIYKEAINAL